MIGQIVSEMKIKKGELVSLIVRIGLTVLAAVAVLASSSTVHAKKVRYMKTQEVNFDGSDVDGKGRNPDGAYLAQKRGVDFAPLYQVRQNFDDSIREMARYVK